ncbi:phosphoribosylglycinamide formyltransferase [Salegentibacter salinarum]|uniref:Phosphoribosylglycinamide formyltransferase n=1 Tax=Salegentibacter salinarum TaxID=447422 RepID=A0A2N0U3G9_9FLAO|nr:phosphoribosylglycinamide formyltransferase [Salegentibacter salinarum]PKD21543.1 phosphoribosylglycinamide formyltransferase [Salegentibacter salinarum]SKB36960.1 phosphoribosylglycinamide formyltransferase-1 [Salegentibacter salinarum]
MSNPTHTAQKKIVVFASGSGTNAENIIKYFQKQPDASVVAVFSNKRSAKVLKRAHDLNVKALYFDRDALYNSHDVLHILEDINPDLIVLAGFMWIFPTDILKRFPNRIINIHPALLPKYGGKGMYGMHVHQAIIQNKEKESGISIHYVNENYDEGEVIFQAKTEISEEDTPDTLAQKIHKLEYRHFPEILQQILQKKSQ